MTLSAGWMMPEMNCALKLASNSASFSSSNFIGGLLLAAEDLHDVAPGVHLLDVAVERAGALPLRRELLLRALRDEDRDDHRERHGEQRDRGEQPVDPEHHREHADDGEQRRDDLREALLERVGDVVDVVGHAREDVAARVAVEVAQRQPRELLVDLVAQAVDDALRHADGEVLLQPLEDGAEQVDEARAGAGVRAMTAKSGPSPGVSVIEESILACCSAPGCPLASSFATASACVSPGAICALITPWNSTFVTCAEDLRAGDVEATLKIASRMMNAMVNAWGLSRLSRPLARALEVLRLGDRSAARPVPAAGAEPAAASGGLLGCLEAVSLCSLTRPPPGSAASRRSRGRSRSSPSAPRGCPCRRSSRSP